MSFLEEDTIKVAGQQYALISVVSPTSNQKSDACAVKIRGVFSTMEEAQNHAKRLVRIDQQFDIHLVELYKWLTIPPPQEGVTEEHQDSHLNELLKGHSEQQDRAREFFEDRKNDLVTKKKTTDMFEEVDPKMRQIEEVQQEQ